MICYRLGDLVALYALSSPPPFFCSTVVLGSPLVGLLPGAFRSLFFGVLSVLFFFCFDWFLFGWRPPTYGEHFSSLVVSSSSLSMSFAVASAPSAAGSSVSRGSLASSYC